MERRAKAQPLPTPLLLDYSKKDAQMDFLLDNKFTRFMGGDVFWPLVVVLVLLIVGFFIVRKRKSRDDDDE